MERELSFVQAITEALQIALESDPDVVLMGEDIAGGGGRADQGIEEAWGGIMGATKGLYKAFGPERVRDTPISEMGFMGTAVGAAATGLRPVVELMFIDFIGVALDPLLNQAAKFRYMFGGKVRVVDVRKGRIWPEESIGREVAVVEPPADNASETFGEKLALTLGAKLGEKIGFLFTDHKEDIMRPPMPKFDPLE